MFTLLAGALGAPYTNKFVRPACGGSNLLPAFHLTPATRPIAVLEEAARARANRPDEIDMAAQLLDIAALKTAHSGGALKFLEIA